MAFLLAADVIRRAGKDLWWRVTPDSCGKDDICVGSRQKWEDVLPAFIEADLLRSKSVGGGKYELQYNEEKWKDMQQHLKEHCSLKLHLSTCRPRGKTRRRALYVFLLTGGQPPEILWTGGTEGAREKNPDEVLFSGRSTVLATKLGERLSAHRKEAQSAHCEARVKSLVDEAKKLGWMPASLLSMLKGTGDTSATEAAAASPMKGLGGADASVVCATSSDIDEQVKVALGLDFVVRMANDDMLRPPRPNATVTEPTPIRKEKQANERMRFSAVALADWWGHGDPTRTHEDRQQIATAACRQVACDHGHAKSTGGSQLYKWRDQLYKSLTDGISNPIGRKEVRGRKAHTDMIEEKEPGHLRELHRHAARMKGAMATFKELADCMSAKSATPDEDRLTISLHRLQLFRWWKKQGGKEKSSIEKPRLTPEHCRKRLDWIEKWEDITTDPNIPVAYLDEKWFYTATRRRKIKMLPLSDEELSSPNLASIHASEASPKIRSRRHPVKVVHLGVVGRPMKDETKDVDFNGRIMIKRVAREQKVEKLTRNQNFSPGAKVNDALKNDKDWRDICDENADMTAGHLCDHIAEIYGLSEFVTERLEFQHEDYKSDGQAKSRKHAALLATIKRSRVSSDTLLTAMERR